MLTPRVKIYAIFSHYQVGHIPKATVGLDITNRMLDCDPLPFCYLQVENFPVLPTQREIWPELEQTRELRTIEMENNADVFRPWEEVEHETERTASVSVPSQ